MVKTTDLDLTSSTAASPSFRSSAVVTPTTAGFADGSDGVTMSDRADLTKLTMRCDPASAAASWMAVSFGSARSDGDVLIVGMRPDEFWLIGPADGVERARADVPTSGLRSEVDLTHGRALVQVSGPRATKMLEKVCGLDWSENMTPPGSAVSASVAKVSCDIVRAGDSYLISCDRSFGQYLIESLADAAQEFGLTLGD